MIAFNIPHQPKCHRRERNSNKFCKFYNEPWHDTDDFFALTDDIERLIRECYLKEYIKEDYPLTGTLNTGGLDNEFFVNQI